MTLRRAFLRYALLPIITLGLLGLSPAALSAQNVKVTYLVTNQGEALGNKAVWAVFKPGARDKYLARAISGQSVEIPPGAYDVRIEYRDDMVKAEKWLENETFQETLAKSVELEQATALVKYTITNNGEELGSKAWWGVYKPGEHERYLAYKYSGKSMRIAAGTYDVGIEYQDGKLKTNKWLENELFQDKLEKTVEMGQATASVTLTITNHGQDLGQKAWWGVYTPGEHERYLAYEISGRPMVLAAGTYDIGIHYHDDNLKSVKWLENERLEGKIGKTIELAQRTAEVKLTITNNGADLAGKAWWGIYKPGERDRYLAYKHSGQSMTLAAGTYDIGIHHQDDRLDTTKWLENEALEGTINRTIELGESTANATVRVTNGGQEVGQKAWWAIYKPGEHGRYLAYKVSSQAMTVEAGTYDIGIHFEDGDAKTTKWLPGERVEGRYAKTVELGFPTAKVKVIVLNNGQDVGRKAWAGLYEPGERHHYYAYKYNGQIMTVAEQTYDIGVHFEEGAVKIDRWLTGVEAKGSLEKVVDLSAGIARVRPHISRAGKPLEHAWCGAYKTKQAGAYQAYGYSGKTFSVEEGIYDIGCFDQDRGLSISKWIERKELKGNVELNVELDAAPASLTVIAGSPPKSNQAAAKNGASSDAIASKSVNIAMILDASGSMAAKAEEKKTRLEVAKEVLSQVIDRLPQNGVRVELSVYGTAPKARVDCQDMKTLYPLGDVNPAALKSAISAFEPSGYTPIAYSLEKAAGTLPSGESNSLILVTDGIESCGGDPCAVSARLAAQGVVSRSYVVGFGLGPDKGRFLSCIGRYYPVEDREELQRALQEVLAEASKPITGHVLIYRGGDHREVVAQGALNEKLVLPAGKYDVVLQAGGKQFNWNSLEIQGDLVSPAGDRPAF